MANVRVKKKTEIEEEKRKQKTEEMLQQLLPTPEERIANLERAILVLTSEN